MKSALRVINIFRKSNRELGRAGDWSVTRSKGEVDNYFDHLNKPIHFSKTFLPYLCAIEVFSIL